MDKYVIRSSSTPDLAEKPTKRPMDDAEPWQHPKRFAIPRPVSRDSDINISNRFGNLPVDNEVPVSDAFKCATTKRTPRRIPPIVMELHDDWVHHNIKDIIDKYDKDYHLEYKGSNRVKIQCYSAQSHHAVKGGLLTENAVFHTFTRKDEKSPKAVIKGLPAYLKETLAADLEHLGFPGATVVPIKTNRTLQCPPMLVHLPSGTNMAKFKQIRYIASCAITVQRYKSSNTLGTQCYRCQGFGHASRNCNRPARCVKCSLAHPTAQCPSTGFIEDVRCCNCQQNHPANYSKCKERIKYLERIKSKRDTLRGIIIPSKNRPPTNTHEGSAEIVSATKHTSHPPIAEVNHIRVKALHLPEDRVRREPVMEDTQTLAPAKEDLLPTRDSTTNEMLKILAAIKNLKQEFIKCDSFMDKVILILSHVGHYF